MNEIKSLNGKTFAVSQATKPPLPPTLPQLNYF